MSYEQTNNDQLYLEDGYFDTDGYLVYIAEAEVILANYIDSGYIESYYFQGEGAYASLTAELTEFVGVTVEAYGEWASSTSTSIAVNKSVSASSAISTAFSQTTTISHIEGADLFALTDAQLAAIVARLRDSNTAASGVFNIATDFVRTLSASASADAAFTSAQTAINLRGFDSQQSAAFSLTASANQIFSLSADTTTAVSLTSDAEAIRGFAAAITAESASSASVGLIKLAAVAVTANASQTALLDGVLEAASALTSTATQTADAQRTRDLDSALASTATVSCLAINLQGYDIVVTDFATMSVTAVKTVDVAKALTATVSLTGAGTYTLASGAGLFTVTATVSASSVTLVRNTIITNQSGSGYTHTAIIDTGTKKFGAGALAWTATGESVIYPGADSLPQEAVWDGTNYKLFDAGYVWTSTDGATWSRSTHNLPLPLNNKITYANGYYFYVRGNNTAYYSSNSTTWTQLTDFPANAQTTTSDIYHWGGFYYVLTQQPSNGGIIRFRADTPTDTNWSTPTGSQVTILNATVTQMSPLTFLSSNVVFACVVGGNSRVQRYNGTTLTNIGTTSLTTQTIRSVAWDGSNTYVAVTDTDTVFYTTNAGTNWNSYTLVGLSSNARVRYLNGNWYVSTLFGLYKGSNPASLTFVSANTSTAVYGNKFVALDTYDLGKSKTSTDGTTWTNNSIASVSGLPARIKWSRGDGSDLGNWKTIDFWAYSSFSDYLEILKGAQGQTLQLYTDGGFNVVQRTPSSTFTADSGTFENISTGWHHYRLSRDGTTIAYYVDGVRKVYSTSFPNEFYSAEVTLDPRNYIFQVDELLITDELKTAPSVSSFSVPTGKWFNDSDTDLLVHFDTDFADDSRFNVIPQAAITAVSTITAQLTGPQRLSADLTSTVTMTVIAVKTNEIELTAFTDAALSATVDKIKSAQADLSSTATILIDAVKTVSVNSTVESDTAVLVNLSIVANAVSNVNSAFSLEAVADRIRLAAVDASSLFEQTASVIRTRGLSSDLTLESTQTATALRIKQLASEFNTVASEVAVAYRVADYFVNCDVVATMTTVAEKTTNIFVPVVANIATSVVAVKTADAVAEFNNTVTQTSDIARTRTVDSSMSAAFAQSTATNNIIVSTVALVSDAAVTVTVEAFSGTAVLLELISSLGVSNDRIRSFDSSLASVSSINAVSVKTAEISSDLTANSTLNCTISHILGADIVAGNFATLSATGDSVKEFDSQQSAAVSVAATGQITRPLSAVVNAATVSAVSVNAIFDNNTQAQAAFGLTGLGNAKLNFAAATAMAATLTCTISHIEGANIVADNFATLALVISKQTGFASEMVSTSTVNAVAQEIDDFAAGLVATTALAIEFEIFSRSEAALTATSQMSIAGTAFVGVVANLQVTGFQLTSGREIRLDYISYKIPAETRLHNITSETRIYKVGSETRIYKLRRA